MKQKKLKALFLNCSLKKSPKKSQTDALIKKAVKIYKEKNIDTEVIRVANYNIKFGIRANEGKGDEWPKIWKKIEKCNILIITTPIWMGVRSSICQMVIERLDSVYGIQNKKGQFGLYNKVGAVIVTGNEDGAHSAAETTLFNLSHFGCVIPPNSDSYWVGDAGPGPSYIEAGGEKHLYTNRTIRMLAENTTYFAQLLQNNPIPTNLKDIDKKAAKESRKPT